MFSLNAHSFAFHENLGIDDNKASELYQKSPNDPAILQWKNGLQSAINDMDDCFDIVSAITCQSLIATIISNCKSHPNTLLGCNDSRLPQYPVILQQALDAQQKAKEAREKRDSQKFPIYALGIIDMCFSSPNSNSTFEVASPVCDRELLSLQHDCQLAASPYNYCNDERFVGYLKKNGILNATSVP
jgi:hypothetical protein